MDFGFQLKLRGSDFNGHFTNGLSMADSQSVRMGKKIYEDDDKAVFESDLYRATAYHIKKSDVYECYTVVENISDRDFTLDMLASFCIKNIDADKIHRATSFWAAEGKLLSQNLYEMNMEKSWSGHGARIEKFGQVGSMPVRKWFPFVALENSKTNEFIGVQLYCASSWQIELFRCSEPLTLAGGLADFDYGHWCRIVKAGEKFTSPRATVAVGNSLNDVCDKLVKFQSPKISRVDEDMPVVFNEYCTTWGNPTMENIERIAKKNQRQRYQISCS